MKDSFVLESTAKLLKQIGFDIPVSARYFKGRFELNRLGNLYNHNKGEISINYISAPTLWLVHHWLLKNYNLYIKVDITGLGYFVYEVFSVYNTEGLAIQSLKSSLQTDELFPNLDLAFEEGILYCISKINSISCQPMQPQK